MASTPRSCADGGRAARGAKVDRRPPRRLTSGGAPVACGFPLPRRIHAQHGPDALGARAGAGRGGGRSRWRRSARRRSTAPTSRRRCGRSWSRSRTSATRSSRAVSTSWSPRRCSSRRRRRAASRSSSSSRPRSSTRSPQPTDAEIQKVFDENKEQLGEATLDQVKPQIVEYLLRQSTPKRQQALIDGAEEEVPDQGVAARRRWSNVERRQLAGEGQSQGAGDDRRVLRLRVPVLQARRADAGARC